MSQPPQSHRLSQGGLIDRERALRFRFNGAEYRGYTGDTLASALLANGVHFVARSFKYHRRRGIFGSGVEEPNAIFQVGQGARSTPNLRATQVELYDGLSATSVNCWPSLRFDASAINDIFSALLPAGFYYKTFMRPRRLWMWYEKIIRRAAGFGHAPQHPDADCYEKINVHCDVLVAGAGPAGLTAALVAAKSGARVILADEQPCAGGALLATAGVDNARTDTECINDMPALTWATQTARVLTAMDEVTYLPRTAVCGYFDHNFLTLVERVTDHLSEPRGELLSTSVTKGASQSPRQPPRQRLWRVRAKRVVLATGALERPLVFANNDIPGIMLASAVSQYIRRYAVRVGKCGVLFTTNDHAYRAVLDMLDAGMSVSGVVDARPTSQTNGTLPTAVRARGVTVWSQCAIAGVHGTRRVRGVQVVPIDAQQSAGACTDDDAPAMSDSTKVNAPPVATAPTVLKCDVLAVSGGWNPTVHLHAQSGARPVFDASCACFVPGESVQDEQSTGAANGVFTLQQCLREGFNAGREAARAAGFDASANATGDAPVTSAASSPRTPATHATNRAQANDARNVQTPLWFAPLSLPHAHCSLLSRFNVPSRAPKRFVDYQNDTSVADLQLAVREGYESIEHVKRYTALGFGTDQGKLGNINGMAIVAKATGRDLAVTGTTTFRPPWTPITLGALSGRELGDLFEPIRKTALHAWHIQHAAELENVGQWKRPWFYPQASESMHDAVNRECLATRNGAGILDASTLGKIDVSGRDAADFLNRIYTNNWSKLKVGQCRYGLMLGEDGMVMDDGVTSRIAEHRYHMTTTTGGAAHVLAWMERWLQTEWPQLHVHLQSVSDAWSAVSLAGPVSRTIMQTLCKDIDFAPDAFPFMSWRAGTVAGIAARVFRISFSGELCYEINVAADYSVALWQACMEAGDAHNITPYGTEAMHVLRAEKGFIIVGQDTDGSVTPVDLGMQWILSRNKDYLGKRSLARSDCTRTGRKQLVGLRTSEPRTVLPEGAQLIAHRELDKARAGDFSSEAPLPMIGHVTSSYYSACLGHSIALALVKNGRARHGERVYAPLADGNIIAAVIGQPVFYDTDGVKQRA